MLTAVPCLEQLVTVYWKKSSSYIVKMCSVRSLNRSVVSACVGKSPTQLQIQERFIVRDQDVLLRLFIYFPKLELHLEALHFLYCSL